MTCQCGCGRPVEVTRPNEQEGQPYLLCMPCAGRLETLSLRPLEWFNLASIHSPWKHYVHDDYYGATGKARQPEGEVVNERGLMRSPTLVTCAKDIEKLFGYAYTRHFLEPKTIEAFHAFDPTTCLVGLEASLSCRLPNSSNLIMACRIAADVLGPSATSFVRRNLPSVDTESFPALVCAASTCLPREEALPWAFAFLDGLDARERFDLKDALIHFNDEQVLDWIERHSAEIERASSWQRLAAFSSFSWSRTRTWLRSGRPLSLVALGALRESFHFAAQETPNDAPVKPIGFPSFAEVEAELDAYLERDGSPNARNQVGELKFHLSR